MANCNIKRLGDIDKNCYDVTLKGMTRGKIMAITRALMFYNSPVGNDVLGFIRNAVYKLGDAELSKDVESSFNEVRQFSKLEQ